MSGEDLLVIRSENIDERTTTRSRTISLQLPDRIDSTGKNLSRLNNGTGDRLTDLNINSVKCGRSIIPAAKSHKY